MPVFEIFIEGTDRSFTCRAGQNVLQAMEQMGTQGVPVGCRGGGCGVCRVQVLGSGKYRSRKMTRAQVTMDDEQHGICLACKLIPDGDLRLRPLGKLRHSFNDLVT